MYLLKMVVIDIIVNGAEVILRRENPNYVTFSCTNRALELACATASKDKISKLVWKTTNVY